MNLSFLPKVISSLNVPQIVDWRRELPVNPNYSWAELAGMRGINTLTTIVCHHDAISKSTSAKKSDLQLAQSIATTHINSKDNEVKGDASFPYHLWIRNGTVYYCNNIEDRTYGVKDNNGYTVHVCVSGQYANYDSLTDADRNALYAVLYTLSQSMPAYAAIKSHGEIKPTLCPGYAINKVREDVLTWTNKFMYMDSEPHAQERAFKIANQILYFYNLAQGKNPDGSVAAAGNVEWGKNVLLALDPFMVERNLL